MQAYAGVLDDAQIEAILDYIKGTWPERERDIQQSR
jgi:mono/diheme cytochrome c family protein